ncbi:MAG: fructose 1,6-bisphosphatase [Deltaproteobacteria bacterium]|nr:fructose 1,6-bisphosphatase [Deltaproteobacteria bacterium]
MAEKSKVTLSVIKADVGGFVGHTNIHPDVIDAAKERLHNSKEKGAIIDYHVLRCGDDLELIMTHDRGPDNSDIHGLAWSVFVACTEVAREMKLYGAGQDILKDAFSGNIRGMGPGVAEMEFVERKSEPILVFMADKTSSGAWNLPLYKIFADPFNTAGLVIDTSMTGGFSFRVVDVKGGREITLKCPLEIYTLLALIGTTSRYMVSSVTRNSDGEICAVVSTQKLSLIAGRYVGKDDPVAVFRTQAGLPAVGEVLEAFTFPHLVDGWMRGSHTGPLMPVPFYEANPTRFDGPPRVIAAGFQLCNGRLIGPHDMFDDPGFDSARRRAGEISDYMRGHGPFEPHRLPEEEMEYTTMPQVLESLKGRFKKCE